MRRCLAEMFGTFALVFAGTGAIVVNHLSGGSLTHVGVSLVFGLVVMAMIYAVGDVSGAHLNPAVTVGFWLAGRFAGARVIPYALSQFAGAILASALIRALFGLTAALGATRPSGSATQAFAMELILTGLLMFVILCVSSGSKEVGVMAGIAIGGVIAFEALVGGPVSGASMNPARSLAPAVVGGTLNDLWIYLVAPVLGATAAVPCWRVTRVRMVVTE